MKNNTKSTLIHKTFKLEKYKLALPHVSAFYWKGETIDIINLPPFVTKTTGNKYWITQPDKSFLQMKPNHYHVKFPDGYWKTMRKQDFAKHYKLVNKKAK